VKFGTNIGGTVSSDWANMAQQELCKAKVRRKFSALKKKFNESHDSSTLSQLGHHRTGKKSTYHWVRLAATSPVSSDYSKCNLMVEWNSTL
jgi:hypothetical protein